MNRLFITVLSLSLSGTLLMGLMLLLKPLIGKYLTKTALYCLWIMVLLRFVLPISLPINAFNIVSTLTPDTPIAQPASQELPTNNESFIVGFVQAAQAQIGDMANGVNANDEVQAHSNAQIVMTGLWIIWLLGVFVAMARVVVSYARFARYIRRTSVPCSKQDEAILNRLHPNTRIHLVYNQHIQTPLLMGLLRPRIVIPLYHTGENASVETKYTLMHELTHYKRGDLFIKWITAIIAAVHWFNPFMRIIKTQLQDICELSCDEMVIRKLPGRERIRYGEALINLSDTSDTRLPKTITTAFIGSRLTLRERILGIKNYRKPTAGMMGITVAVALLITGCSVFLGNTGLANSSENTPPSPAILQDNTLSTSPAPNPSPTPAAIVSGPLVPPAWDDSIEILPLNLNSPFEALTLPENTSIAMPDIHAWQYNGTSLDEDDLIALGRTVAGNLWPDAPYEEREVGAWLMLERALENTQHGAYAQSITIDATMSSISYHTSWVETEQIPFGYGEPPVGTIPDLIKACRDFAKEMFGHDEFVQGTPIVDANMETMSGRIQWRYAPLGMPAGDDGITFSIINGHIADVYFTQHALEPVETTAPVFVLDAHQTLYSLNYARSNVVSDGSAFFGMHTLHRVWPVWTNVFGIDESEYVPGWEFVLTNEGDTDEPTISITAYVNATTGEVFLGYNQDGLYASPYVVR